MTLLAFPDINVWLALSYSGHVHHRAATEWFASLDVSSELFFCRFTQLGLLRLLTTSSVMGSEVKTQRQAWRRYDDLIRIGVRLIQEPSFLEESFRSFANLNLASPKDWADSYLSAFALETDTTLVTFDKVLSSRATNSIFLKPAIS